MVGQIHGGCDLTADQFTGRLVLANHRNGDGGKKRLGIGMHWIGKQLIGPCLFHHLAQIHDRDVVREILDDREVMGDKDIGKSNVLLQLFQQVQDLRLNRNVQCGNRFVADD